MDNVVKRLEQINEQMEALVCEKIQLGIELGGIKCYEAEFDFSQDPPKPTVLEDTVVLNPYYGLKGARFEDFKYVGLGHDGEKPTRAWELRHYTEDEIHLTPIDAIKDKLQWYTEHRDQSQTGVDGMTKLLIKQYE